VDLVLPGESADLLGGLGEADHAGGADGVGGEHPAGGVPRDVAVGGGGAGLGEPPAFAGRGEAEVLQPHRLVPAERHVHLGGVQVAAGVGDAGLGVDVGGAVPSGARVDGV